MVHGRGAGDGGASQHSGRNRDQAPTARDRGGCRERVKLGSNRHVRGGGNCGRGLPHGRGCAWWGRRRCSAGSRPQRPRLSGGRLLRRGQGRVCRTGRPVDWWHGGTWRGVSLLRVRRSSLHHRSWLLSWRGSPVFRDMCVRRRWPRRVRRDSGWRWGHRSARRYGTSLGTQAGGYPLAAPQCEPHEKDEAHKRRQRTSPVRLSVAAHQNSPPSEARLQVCPPLWSDR